jgi:hypothetical protein
MRFIKKFENFFLTPDVESDEEDYLRNKRNSIMNSEMEEDTELDRMPMSRQNMPMEIPYLMWLILIIGKIFLKVDGLGLKTIRVSMQWLENYIMVMQSSIQEDCVLTVGECRQTRTGKI